MTGAGCDDYKLFLTGSNNFRIHEATILPYKGHRKQEKPYWHKDIKKYFMEGDKYKDKVDFSEDYEADDALSIELRNDVAFLETIWNEDTLCEYGPWESYYEYYATCVLCTIDKDLDMCPGKHAKWGKNKKTGKFEVTTYTVTQEEGTWWFYRQLLTGDMTDNILGLFGMGEVSAKRLLKGIEDELDLYIIVQKRYEQRFGSYWEKFLHENARLLWMLESPTDDIRVHLREMESTRQDHILQKQIEEEVY